MKKSNKKGFTLVELVVVIAIIGVLAAILVPSMLGYVKKSRLKTANANAKTAYNAISGLVTERETAGTPLGLSALFGATFDCRNDVTTPSSDNDYVQHELYKALGDNDKEAGEATIVQLTGATITNSKAYAVQWHKAPTDKMIGQFPDAIADVDKAEAATFGTFVAP